MKSLFFFDYVNLHSAVSAAWSEAFPEHAAIWPKLRKIQQADLGRLAILYLHGGVYLDFDIAVNANMDLALAVERNGFDAGVHDAGVLFTCLVCAPCIQF